MRKFIQWIKSIFNKKRDPIRDLSFGVGLVVGSTSRDYLKDNYEAYLDLARTSEVKIIMTSIISLREQDGRLTINHVQMGFHGDSPELDDRETSYNTPGQEIH